MPDLFVFHLHIDAFCKVEATTLRNIADIDYYHNKSEEHVRRKEGKLRLNGGPIKTVR